MPQTTDTTDLGQQLQAAYDACLHGCAAASPALEPLLKVCARGNQEYMALVGRRARSYLELPQRLGQCRTAQDLVTEQTRFWTECCQDYAEATQKLTQAWASMLQQPFGEYALAEREGRTASERREVRDRVSNKRVA
jgi:hypothetical protein